MNRESTIRDWLADPRGKVAIDPIYRMMTAQEGGLLDVGEDGSDAIGMDVLGFMLDMPLLSMLQFDESQLPMPAREIVDTLLAQVKEAAE